MNNTAKEIVVRIKARRINKMSTIEWMAVQFHPVNPELSNGNGILFLASISGLTGIIKVRL